MLMDIILYLLHTIQELYRQNCWLIHFLCRYIPLNQWAFDDSHSPKYQKFKIDELPLITDFRQGWIYKDLIPYYEKRYGKKIRPISRRSDCDIPDNCTCPRCNAPKPFLYKNNGSKGQLLCKICAADSPRRKVASPQSNCAVPTVGTLWFPRKTASTLSSISVSILNALTISTTSKRWISKTLTRITAKININSTISTVSS